MVNTVKRAWLAAASAMLVTAADVDAQTAAPPAALEADESTGALIEIVVTARRRAESIQDVPISITAYTGEALSERGLNNLGALTNFTPNLEINNGRPDGGGSTAQIFIRGVGQNDFLIPNDPGVGLYVDDVYVARSTGALVGLVDTASVEVLRGPQGTLYGKNTIGGALRITSVLPDFDAPSSKVGVTVGSYSRLDFNGSLNLPFSDQFAVRIAGSSRNTDDLGKRVLDAGEQGTGNINQDAVRVVARYKPSDPLDIVVSGDYTRTRQHGPFGANSGFVAGGSALIDVLNAEVYPTEAVQFGQPAGTIFDQRWVSSPEVDYGTGSNFDDYDTWGVAGTVSYDLNSAITLKSISAYRSVDGAAGRDGDHSPFPVLDTISADRNTQLSQEFQLNGRTLGQRLNWTLGLYYIEEDLYNQITTKLWDGLVRTSIGVDFNALSQAKLRGQSLAAFGQATLDVTDRTHVTIGGRYNEEKKNFNNRWYFLETPREFTCPGVAFDGTFDDCKLEATIFTPMASFAFDFTDDVLGYLSYSEGFKTGGWTPRLFSQQSLKEFRPEELRAYEVGVKSAMFDRRLILNADVFYSDYKNIQLTSVLADSQGNPQPVVENAGVARIVGAEAELTARLGQATTLQLAAGYMDAEYTKLDPGVSFGIDNKLPDTAPWTVSASLEHVVTLGSGADVKLRLDGSYKAKTYKDPGNSRFLIQDPYTIVNARIGYEAADGRWGVALFGTNLLDELYLTNGLDLIATFGFIESYYGRPREWGLEFSFRP